MKNTVSYFAILISILALVLATIPGGPTLNFSGVTNFDEVDVTDGYKVDGTTVIDGDGNVDASITSDTGTFSSTLTVSGESNLARTITGGSVTTISATGSHTLTAANICDSSIINYEANTTTTATMPTAAALITDCLPAAGDTTWVMFANTATQSVSIITLALSGSMELLASASPSTSFLTIAQNSWSRLNFMATSSAGVILFIEKIVDGD